MASLTQGRLISALLRHLYKQVPAGIEKRCVSAISGTAATVNNRACFINESVITDLLDKPLKDTLETHGSMKCDNLVTATQELCLAFDSLSVIQSQWIERTSNRSLDFLSVNNKDIRDIPRIPSLKYDLPKVPGLNIEITTPSSEKQITSLDTPGTNQIEKISPGTSQPAKYASSTTIKMKRRKMKKHRLRRLRKRLWAAQRKIKFKKLMKKKQKLNAELHKIKKEGEEFDAEAFIREKIEKARKGGYMIDILKTAQADKFLSDKQ